MLTSATSASFREVVFKGGRPILGHTKSSPGQGYAGRKSKWESAADPLSKSSLLCRECCPRLDGMIALFPHLSLHNGLSPSLQKKHQLLLHPNSDYGTVLQSVKISGCQKNCTVQKVGVFWLINPYYSKCGIQINSINIARGLIRNTGSQGPNPDLLNQNLHVSQIPGWDLKQRSTAFKHSTHLVIRSIFHTILLFMFSNYYEICKILMLF